MNYPTVAIKLTEKAEKMVKKGHPWVFENSIEKRPNKDLNSGTICVLFGKRNNKPYAFGLWDSDEIIRIKIISFGTSFQLETSFWNEKILLAKSKRSDLVKKVNGFRAIHGENDGFPGLILDIYNGVGTLKIYSEIWRPYIDDIIDLCKKAYDLKSLVIRYNRKLSQSNAFHYPEGTVIGEDLANGEVVFDEYGVKFYAYPISGHKTGFFLDQRPNRYWVQQHAKGKSILDVFSYVGGFGVHGLKGGAKSLVSVDISQQAMDVAQKNLELNHIDLSKWNPMVGDAFKILDEMIKRGDKYDIVILDPPSFAKQNSQIVPALKQYGKLAKIGAKLTAKNGFLILGSCSSRINLEQFQQTHQSIFANERINFSIEKITLHDVDHPIGFSEGLYLKTIIYRIQ